MEGSPPPGLSQGAQATSSDPHLPPQSQAMDFQYGREYAWMMNVFSVVVAYSITCPIIVPFGEASLGHPQGCAPSGWEEGLSPPPSEYEEAGRGQTVSRAGRGRGRSGEVGWLFTQDVC